MVIDAPLRGEAHSWVGPAPEAAAVAGQPAGWGAFLGLLTRPLLRLLRQEPFYIPALSLPPAVLGNSTFGTQGERDTGVLIESGLRVIGALRKRGSTAAPSHSARCVPVVPTALCGDSAHTRPKPTRRRVRAAAARIAMRLLPTPNLHPCMCLLPAFTSLQA